MDGTYKFINKEGVVAIPSSFESPGTFSDGLAGTSSNQKCGYIDKTGNIVIPCIYESAYSFSEGFGLIRMNGKLVLC